MPGQCQAGIDSLAEARLNVLGRFDIRVSQASGRTRAVITAEAIATVIGQNRADDTHAHICNRGE